jgi:adenylate cyclase
VSFWVLAVLFLTFYDRALLLFDPAISPAIEAEDYDFWTIFIISLAATIIGGIFIASIEVLYFDKLLRKKPFGISMLIKTGFYMVNILFFTSLAEIVNNYLRSENSLSLESVIDIYAAFFSSPRSLSIWIFWGIAVTLALFILQISDKLGQGVLFSYILGKYHRPRQESRIFMFLDLKSSTSYAEQLGHIKYSRLIQDCFYDLTDVVTNHQAQIYQYIGDEVVLTWKVKDGLSNQNCINTYFDFEKGLLKRRQHYEKEYGLMPEFKAGLDSGPITVAEVGELKKELAYHGDIINTASRIQEMCNQYQSKILISERLKNQLNGDVEREFELIGNIKLKGKNQAINVYRVSNVSP